MQNRYRKLAAAHAAYYPVDGVYKELQATLCQRPCGQMRPEDLQNKKIPIYE